MACAIAAVEPGVRQHAGRDAGVGALRHILAVVPQNGARAAVQIQGLIGLVAHEDVGAGLDRCAVGAGRHTPLDDKHEDLLLLGLTDAGARLDAVEGLVVLHGGLTVHNEGGPEFHGVRRVGCDRCGGVRDVEQVALAQLDALVAGDDIVLAAAYEKENKNVRIEVGEGGSSQGIKDTQDGKNDIGMASRDLKKDSVTGEYTETGLDKIQIAYDGVAVIINKEASIEGNNVTNEQLYALYAYGTPIGEISLPVSREDGSGTREAFDEKITDAEGNKLIDLTKFTSGIQIANGTNIVMTDVAGNVAKLGYISMGSLNDTVKAVKYNGVEPTVENVKNGTYKLARPFLIVTKSGAELSQAAKDFIDFILSEAGQKIVAEEGYVAM